ncbi:hypothetical protein LCGC14_1641560 [marine sediment metagenome]|uniref:AMP-activated protein kinase glycogen-binding domain-containing protein n=1 Tax=marine sediment metagenome TaxID=412755 RepID=A0A0F9KZ39_9ZZZZ
MYEQGRTRATVRFAVKAPDGAGRAFVVGDFSDWQPLAMRRQKDGTFVRHVPISQERFEYKFIVDEQWIMDPDTPEWVLNPYGSFNCAGRTGPQGDA